jgi:hypothetical protein
MKSDSSTLNQTLVFLLVGSAFTMVYITQPVLPVIENEFAVNARTASLSVSMVIFGIAVANLPLTYSPIDIRSNPLSSRAESSWLQLAFFVRSPTASWFLSPRDLSRVFSFRR